MDSDDQLSKRLTEHLGATADNIAAPPGAPMIPVAIAGRRRRTRRSIGGSLAAVALVATAIGASQLSGGGGAIDLATDDGGSEDIATEADDATNNTGGTGDATAQDTSRPTTGGMLPASTGVELQWAEVASPAGFSANSAIWTGSAFLALSFDGSQNSLLRSVDGSAWTQLATPGGHDFWGLQGNGDTLVLWGSESPIRDDEAAPRPEPFGPTALAVFTSTDGGGNWTAAPVLPEGESQSTSAYVQYSSSVSGAAVQGDSLVIAISRYLQFDIQAIADDFGLDLSSEMNGWGQSDSELSICLDNNCNREATLTYEELGLSPEEIDEVFSGGGAGQSMVLQSSGGSPWEAANLPPTMGWIDSIVAVNGQFFLSVMAPNEMEDGTDFYASTDGLSWSLVSSGNRMGGLSTDGQVLYVHQWGEFNGVVRSDDNGVTWQPVVTDTNNVHQAKSGPSGVVVTGQLYDESDYEEALYVSIEKDGYTVNWLGDEGITVVETETGDTVLEYGPETLAADEPPETVLEAETNDEWSLTFLHPDTLEPLVTLSAEDMDEAFGYDSPAVEDYQEPEFFIGWSGDQGQTWGYQSATEAFGSNGWTEVIVGDGVIVAFHQEVDAFQPEPEASADAPWEPSTKIFVATVD